MDTTYKLIARKKPYKTYIAGLPGCDTEVQGQDFITLYSTYMELVSSKQYWLVELLEPTTTGKMVAHHKHLELPGTFPHSPCN